MRLGVCSKMLNKGQFVRTSRWMSNCYYYCLMPRNKQPTAALNQANIDSVTAELGRHTGDVGVTKRLAALEKVMEKQQNDAVSHGAKARRKKDPQSLLPR
jgi:hypothetical protein